MAQLCTRAASWYLCVAFAGIAGPYPCLVADFHPEAVGCIGKADSVVPHPLMSSAGRATSRLEDEVVQLRALVLRLQERVEVLEERVADSEFCLVEGGEKPDPPLVQVPSVAAAAPIVEVVDSKREEILRNIGNWIRKTLAGQRRGVSGRDQIKESSNFYLVFRSYSGQEFNPVRVFNNFSAASREVKARGDVGDSVFIGLPNLQDCKVVTREAGLTFPSNLSYD